MMLSIIVLLVIIRKKIVLTIKSYSLYGIKWVVLNHIHKTTQW